MRISNALFIKRLRRRVLGGCGGAKRHHGSGMALSARVGRSSLLSRARDWKRRALGTVVSLRSTTATQIRCPQRQRMFWASESDDPWCTGLVILRRKLNLRGPIPEELDRESIRRSPNPQTSRRSTIASPRFWPQGRGVPGSRECTLSSTSARAAPRRSYRIRLLIARTVVPYADRAYG